MPEELPDGLTEQQLRFGYWYTTHKVLLRKILTIVLLIWGGWLWISALAVGVDWMLVGGKREALRAIGLQKDRVDFRGFAERNAPVELELSAVKVIPGGSGASDYLITIKNPNKRWSAEFTGVFRLDEKETAPLSGFVLPGEESTIISFANPVAGSETPSFRFVNFNWRRVSPHAIIDYALWAKDRMKFTVTGASTTPIEVGGKHFAQTSFTLTNNTNFGYWHVPVQIFLERAGDIAAVSGIVLDNVRPHEVRKVEARWFYDVPSVQAIRVRPVINILDPTVYALEELPIEHDVREEELL